VIYPEPLVARTTGVNRETVAATRKAALAKGTDWTLENSVVCYTAPGLEKLISALGLAETAFVWPAAPTATGDRSATPPRAESGPEKFAAQCAGEPPRPLAELRVVALSRNPAILQATPDGGATTVCVRVRSNANFLPGMPLRARAPAPGASLYHFEGQCPRWKGRY
jgi:hypothetical protein